MPKTKNHPSHEGWFFDLRKEKGMRTFKIPRAPFGDEKIYAKSKVTFEPGVTVLVGCNGVGKTTMLRLVERELKNAELPCLYYDNLTEGGIIVCEARAGTELPELAPPYRKLRERRYGTVKICLYGKNGPAYE
jgi:hypothetical protein